MRKIMFLALVLSAVAVGSASANDGARRPAGISFGIGGDNGFVVVDVRAPHDNGRGCGDFALECRPHGKGDCHHGRDRRGPRPPKPRPHGKPHPHGKHHDHHHGHHGGKPHGNPHGGHGGDRPHGPGMPPPPPGRR